MLRIMARRVAHPSLLAMKSETFFLEFFPSMDSFSYVWMSLHALWRPLHLLPEHARGHISSRWDTFVAVET